MVPLDADIMNVMRKENSNSQYKSITEICLTSRTRVKHVALTVDIRKEVIWELLDRIINACFGNVIRQFKENNLKRVNDVSFRTAIAVKSEKIHN